MKAKKNRFRPVILATIVAMTQITITGNTFAQGSDDNTQTHIRLIARTTADSIVLRWAPTTPGGWSIANTIGYRVERIEIKENEDISSRSYIALVNEPIKPMDLDAWKTYAGPDNKFSAIAAQAIYGRSVVPRPLAADSLITLRNAADELSNRYSFALFAADNCPITANAIGLRFVDKNIKQGSQYAYRVFVAEKVKGFWIDTAYILVDTRKVDEIYPPTGFNYRSGDGSIHLTWEKDPLNAFSGYYLYRSSDNGKTFLPLNAIPLVFSDESKEAVVNNFLYIDTATVNYKPYLYRLVGVTPFGERSQPVEIKAMSRDLTPPPTPLAGKPQQVDNYKIKVTWELKNPPADLKGIMIARTHRLNEDVVWLTPKPLSPETKEFTDDLGGGYEAYYIVASVDTAGNMNLSSPIFATLTKTPVPQAPKNIKGSIDENGRVTLSWDPINDRNIIGYRVLKANAPNHEFIQITGHVHPDTIFVDSISLNTLTKHVYYRIESVNSRYQHSEPSSVLKLRRPDKVPPAEAVFKDVKVTDNSVVLEWHCSPSTDVALQQLLRKMENEKEWQKIDSLKPGINRYVDSRVQPRVTYFYSIVSIDSSGNASKLSEPVSVRPYDPGKLDPVKNFSVQQTGDKKAVLLKWNIEKPLSSESWFLIYKDHGDGSFVELKALKSDVREFTDNAPGKGTIRYAVVVMDRNGKQSEMVQQRITIKE